MFIKAHPGQPLRCNHRYVAKKRITSERAVTVARVVVVEREIANPGIVVTGAVENHCACTIRSVPRSLSVQDEGRDTSRRIRFACVESERSSAETGVIAGSGDVEKSVPAKRAVSHSAREVFKGILSFCRGKPGISSVRRRINVRGGVRHLGYPKTDECQCTENEFYGWNLNRCFHG